MLTDRTTLNQFLIEERRRHPEATGDLNALINDVAIACKAIAKRVAYGGIDKSSGPLARNIQGETQQKLDVLANDIFLRANEWGGHLAGMVSEELEAPYVFPGDSQRAEYLLVFDPLDGSSNIDVNVSVGSIFSILRATAPARTQLRPISCSPDRAGLRRLRDLRPVDDAGADGRQRRARLHARSATRRVHSDPSRTRAFRPTPPSSRSTPRTAASGSPR